MPKQAEENIFLIRKRRHVNSRKPEKVELEDAEKDMNPMEIDEEGKSKKPEKDNRTVVLSQKP